MSGKRILITAGGTGGHLFPAQGLAEELMKEPSVSKVLFAAGGLDKCAYFDRARFSFQEVACSPLCFRNPLKAMKGAVNLFKGFRESRAILDHFRPDVVVGFGSYYTVPILLAAIWLKIPFILHEANSVPGKANQWLSSFASCVALHFPLAASYFKNKTVEVGLPLREGFKRGDVSLESALEYYGFCPSRRTLLICGGSQGAAAINKLAEQCTSVMKRLSLQVIHLTGDPLKAKDLASLYARQQIPACVKPFESRMQMAWGSADCFIGRSGASTIAESVEFEVPGILIPYPYATDLHQDKNADYLVRTIGSAFKFDEAHLTPEKLGMAVEEIFDERRFLHFQEAIRVYKRRPHQTTLCNLILKEF